MLRVEGLTKYYDDKPVLRDLNFEVKRGEIFAVIGPSGAGKSTLLRILDLLEAPTSGGIYLDGSDITRRCDLATRRRMAMVFQDTPVFNMSVFDNVAYGLRLRGEKGLALKRKVEEALGLVGLAGYEVRNAKTLSGGETQRVAFAMATVFKPEVLLLDEPTANLDPISEATVEEIIKRIKRLGITVIVATHKQAEAMTLADSVAVLNAGAIEQVGKPEEIFHRPLTLFVSKFVGTKNIFSGTIKTSEMERGKTIVAVGNFDVEAPYQDTADGTKVHLCIRPEEIMLLREDRPITPRHTNIMEGEIAEIHPLGSAMLRLSVSANGKEFTVDVPRHVAAKMELAAKKKVRMSLKASSCHIIRGST